MTWLKGTTTWANLVDQLTKLACGEVADGSAVTCAAGDQWVREVAGQNILKTKTALDVPMGNMSNRAGYWSLVNIVQAGGMPMAGGPPTIAAGGGSQAIASSLRTSNIFTSNPATTLGRWFMQVSISQANAVAGNYSTCQYTFRAFDADTGTLITSGSGFFNAAGVATIYNGMQCTVAGDTSGFVSNGAVYWRMFNTTYLGGIDWWGPMYPRRSGAATFSVNPPGTITTDWVVVDIPTGLAESSSLSGVNTTLPQSCIGSGLGFKTNTALTGAKYTCTWSSSLRKFRMFDQSGASNGRVGVEVCGGFALNSVTSNYHHQGGYSTGSWLRPYQTSGSVLAGSNIQYWMRVTADTISVVLNADPAESGKSTCGFIGVLTPTHGSTYDKFPVVCSRDTADYTADNASFNFFDLTQTLNLQNQAWRQDGSELVNGRDWQTGWMRTDTCTPTFGSDSYNELQTGWRGELIYSFASSGVATGVSNERPGIFYAQMKPSPWDGKWHLQNIYVSDRPPTGGEALNVVTNPGRADLTVRFIRGHLGTTYYYLSDGGWSNGDELTDSVSGNRYFLMAADYHGIGARYRGATNTFLGGSAIRES